MTKVYLAGGIHGLSDEEVFGWREYVSRELEKYNVGSIDPTKRDYRGKEDEYAEQIVASDLDEIDDCRILLANIIPENQLVGTYMEIFYSSITCWPMTTIVVIPEGHYPSPWLTVHCDYMLTSLDDAIWLIGELFGEEH